MGHSSYLPSVVLVLGRSSIHSLLPSTFFAQVESLLQNGRLAEAEALLERAEADLRQGSTTLGDQTELLRYLHQCLAFTFMRQTRFKEATPHFVKGAVDPRVPVSYFDELRPALFSRPRSCDKDGITTSEGVERDFVEVEIWDGVKAYLPDESSVDDIIATNLVRNYSPYLRPGAIPVEGEHDNAEPLVSDPNTESGTRTHPATIVMREGLREEADEMLKSILAVVLGNAEMWSREIVAVASTALAIFYAHAQDVRSLLALFVPPPFAPSTSRPVSRSSSRPSSRPSSISHMHTSNGHTQTLPSHTQHTSQPSRTISLSPSGPALPFCPEALAPVLARMNLWGALLEMWKVFGDGEKVVDVLVGLTEGKYVDASVIDPLEQIFAILAPARPDSSNLTNGVGLGLNEHGRASLVKKWGAWLAGKDVERGLKLLTSLPPARHRRPTGAANRGRDKAADREQDVYKGDELAILSELRNTNILAAKRYLESLVVGRGLGRSEKDATEEGGLFEELVWNCIGEVLEYARDENVGRLWKAKATSYLSSPSASTVSSTSPPPPPPKSDALSPPIQPSSQSPPRSPFLSYFSTTTPDSPSKRSRIKTLLLLQSLKEGKKVIKDIQDKITSGGLDKILGLEMAILYSKIPSPRITLQTLYALRDTTTAELYASSGGSTGIVGIKVGASAAEGCGLSDWSGWFVKGGGRVGTKGDQKVVQDVDMLKTLLEVYMDDGNTQQTARFLSSQAGRLDTLDILPLVPTTWPVGVLSTYLTRSLRRNQHVAHEGQIVKALCAGQNLAVLERTFEILREEGALVEEAVSDDEEEVKGEEGASRSFHEKVVEHGGAEDGTGVVNIHVGGGDT